MGGKGDEYFLSAAGAQDGDSKSSELQLQPHDNSPCCGGDVVLAEPSVDHRVRRQVEARVAIDVGKLGVVKGVVQFQPVLKSDAAFGSDEEILEQGDVPVVHAGSAD